VSLATPLRANSFISETDVFTVIKNYAVISVCFKVIHVPTLIKNLHNKANKCTKVEIFLHAICHNSDKLRSISIIFRELLNINTAYIKTHMNY